MLCFYHSYEENFEENFKISGKLTEKIEEYNGEKMSKPPEDEDAFFQILEQIKQAIMESEVVEPEDAEIMDELELGIRNSLEALMGLGSKEEPTITVMDGGISAQSEEDKQDSTDKKKPVLTLLSSADSEENDGANDDWDVPNVQVRVLSGESLFQRFGGGRARQEKPTAGLISLQKEESQIILRSEDKLLYRVTCQQGELSVQSHFELLSLKEGQSLDVQTNQLTVVAVEDSSGQYYKI